jgi:hypothetical protein
MCRTYGAESKSSGEGRVPRQDDGATNKGYGAAWKDSRGFSWFVRTGWAGMGELEIVRAQPRLAVPQRQRQVRDASLTAASQDDVLRHKTYGKCARLRHKAAATQAKTQNGIYGKYAAWKAALPHKCKTEPTAKGENAAKMEALQIKATAPPEAFSRFWLVRPNELGGRGKIGNRKSAARIGYATKTTASANASLIATSQDDVLRHKTYGKCARLRHKAAAT